MVTYLSCLDTELDQLILEMPAPMDEEDDLMELGCQPLFVSPIVTPVKIGPNSKRRRSLDALVVTPSREPAVKKTDMKQTPQAKHNDIIRMRPDTASCKTSLLQDANKVRKNSSGKFC
eukprot:Seg1598.5 transcript_id=Seg1598.5/GoldUCD/mRNA.D3Y31 product="hypothetical protein" protein_id=Seg1598.5/GoldUCD/D3Y31